MGDEWIERAVLVVWRAEIAEAPIEPLESTLKSHSRPCQRAVEATKKGPFARDFCDFCACQSPAHASSSSSAFASFRSVVSKPSVNQP